MSASYSSPPDASAQALLPPDFAFALDLVANTARKEAFDVYIGRAFAGRKDEGWGNPYPVKSNTAKARVEAIVSFWRSQKFSQADLAGLSGKRLGCWCAPLLCHGHVLSLASATLHGSSLSLGEVSNWVDELEELAASWPKRLLISGSRDYKERPLVEEQLAKVLSRWPSTPRPVLVSGAAAGVDSTAEDWWRANVGLDCVDSYPVTKADWEAKGRSAGHQRNAAMVASTADGLLAFPMGESKGTRGCMKLAAKAGIPVLCVEVSPPKASRSR